MANPDISLFEDEEQSDPIQPNQLRLNPYQDRAPATKDNPNNSKCTITLYDPNGKAFELKYDWTQIDWTSEIFVVTLNEWRRRTFADYGDPPASSQAEPKKMKRFAPFTEEQKAWFLKRTKPETMAAKPRGKWVEVANEFNQKFKPKRFKDGAAMLKLKRQLDRKAQKDPLERPKPRRTWFTEEEEAWVTKYTDPEIIGDKGLGKETWEQLASEFNKRFQGRPERTGLALRTLKYKLNKKEAERRKTVRVGQDAVEEEVQNSCEDTSGNSNEEGSFDYGDWLIDDYEEEAAEHHPDAIADKETTFEEQRHTTTDPKSKIPSPTSTPSTASHPLTSQAHHSTISALAPVPNFTMPSAAELEIWIAELEAANLPWITEEELGFPLRRGPGAVL